VDHIGEWRRQLLTFVAIGLVSTVVSLVFFVALRPGLGPQPSNLLSILLSAGANTAANRRFTFGVRGRYRLARHHIGGLVALGIALSLSAGALALLHALTDPSRLLEVLALIAAGVVAALVRFLLLRRWILGTANLKSRPTDDVDPVGLVSGSALDDSVEPGPQPL
jgi:putative flippase GtrA